MHHLHHLMLFTSFPSPLLPFILSPPPLPSPSSPPPLPSPSPLVCRPRSHQVEEALSGTFTSGWERSAPR